MADFYKSHKINYLRYMPLKSRKVCSGASRHSPRFDCTIRVKPTYLG
jgi:hypothetical protein